MIYLFEDREQRMEYYLKQKIESDKLSYNCVIDCSKQDLLSLIESRFGDAACVIIHYSYKFPGEGITPDVIKNAFNERGVPVVIFSGDYSSNTLATPNGISNANMRSSSLYENLPLFIRKYTYEGIVSIPLLAFGPKYLLNTLLGLQQTIQNILISLNEDDIIGEDEKDDIRHEVLHIREPELQDVRSQILSILTEPSLVYSRLKTQIQTIIADCQQ